MVSAARGWRARGGGSPRRKGAKAHGADSGVWPRWRGGRRLSRRVSGAVVFVGERRKRARMRIFGKIRISGGLRGRWRLGERAGRRIFPQGGNAPSHTAGKPGPVSRSAACGRWSVAAPRPACPVRGANPRIRHAGRGGGGDAVACGHGLVDPLRRGRLFPGRIGNGPRPWAESPAVPTPASGSVPGWLTSPVASPLWPATASMTAVLRDFDRIVL